MAADLFERLKNAKRLPSPPGVALRVLELAQQEDASLVDIANAVSSDPALSAKLLKFVNSPLAGTSRSVASLHQAIGLMGLRAVKLMALSFSLVSADHKGACSGFDFDQLWSRSLACAVAARTIARRSKICPAEEAFVAGLLRDIGQLVLATGTGELYSKVIQEAAETGDSLAEVEQRVIGTTHTELGGRLLHHWRLPESLCTAVDQLEGINSVTEAASSEGLPRVLFVADLVAAVICGVEGQRHNEVTALLEAVDQLFGWNKTVWQEVFGKITENWQEYGQILSIRTTDVKDFGEIQQEAQDYIAELSLAAQMDVQRVEAKNDELLKRATTDQLTGIGNRAAFDERLELEVNRAVRTKKPLALVMMDIDRFKKFNDTYGHQAGDAVLQAVAKAIADTVRKVDFAARYGGEELAVIAPECEPAGAADLGERLRRNVEAIRVSFNEHQLQVTISVGVILYVTPDGSRCPADLIRAADRLLYKAKSAGRNNVKLAAFRTVPVPAATV